MPLCHTMHTRCDTSKKSELHLCWTVCSYWIRLQVLHLLALTAWNDEKSKYCSKTATKGVAWVPAFQVQCKGREGPCTKVCGANAEQCSNNWPLAKSQKYKISYTDKDCAQSLYFSVLVLSAWLHLLVYRNSGINLQQGFFSPCIISLVTPIGLWSPDRRQCVLCINESP